MPNKTLYNKDWLAKEDENGIRIAQWCSAGKDKYKAYCKFCNKSFSCANQGFLQVLQHARGLTHKKKSQDVLSGCQTVFQAHIASPSNSYTDSYEENRPDLGISKSKDNQKTSQMVCLSSRDEATSAELLWAMKVVKSSYSYSSCDNIKQLFDAMFPGKVPQGFSMSSSKVSYLISDATGPYFQKRLLYDVRNTGSFFTLQFDETTNSQVKKQLDINIRYWSADNEGKTHHLQTYLMGHAPAKDVAKKILKSVEENGLSLGKLVMLESDGPNVNKAIFRIVNQSLVDMGHRGLVNIGSCNLHTVHNAIGKGLKEYGEAVSDLTVDLHVWFQQSAGRRQDFQQIQQELGIVEHVMLRHLNCRWITLLPAVQRIIEQYETLVRYFLIEVPKNPSACSSARYIRIRRMLANKETLVQLYFLESVLQLFMHFLRLFQRNEPLIHVLYDDLLSMVLTLMRRFIKPDYLDRKKEALTTDEVNCSSSWLSLDDIDIGVKAREEMKKLKKETQTLAAMNMRKFLTTVTSYLLGKLPLSNVVKSCRCLQVAAQRNAESTYQVRELAQKLPLNVNVDAIVDEWRVYQAEDIMIQHPDDGSLRIDHYWRDVLSRKTSSGYEKYSTLSSLVKLVLVLSHGNSDVERGFSENKCSVSPDRVNLSVSSINAIRNTLDGLKSYCGHPEKVPITREFIRMGQTAHKLYMTRLEREKEQQHKILEANRREAEKAELERKKKTEEVEVFSKLICDKKTISEKEKTLYLTEAEYENQFEIGSQLLGEARKRLGNALKKKDMKEAQLAQAMLETAEKKMSDAKSNLKSTRNQQQSVEKRKGEMLNALVQKKKKV